MRWTWHTLLSTLSTLALLAVVGLSAPAVGATESSGPDVVRDELGTVPEPLKMGECITCETGYQTAIHWGTGSDCAAATADLDSQLRDAAASACDSAGGNFYCQFQVVITQQCTQKPGYVIVDGYANHGCLFGDFFCPAP